MLYEVITLSGMMTPQGLQILSSKDPLTGLGIIADGVVIVDIVFQVCIADCRRVPMRVQGFTNLFLLHGDLQMKLAFDDRRAIGI